MSCKDCDKIQEWNKAGRALGYIRIGNGDVLIGACDKHFNMIRHAIDPDSPLDRVVVRMNGGE